MKRRRTEPAEFSMLCVLIAAAMFLAGTLCPSWFAVLEALQKPLNPPAGPSS
jgi:hypothetical protein